MDIEWEAPPEEDIDTMLDDEDELEYIREIEMERRRKEQDDLEKMLNSNTQEETIQISKGDNASVNGGIKSLQKALLPQENQTGENKQNLAKRAKRSNSICKEIELSPSPPAVSPQRQPFRDILNLESTNEEVPSDISNPVSRASYRVPQIGERKFYRRIPKGTDFQAVTMSDGERFYMRLLDEEDHSTPTQSTPNNISGLCGLPYRMLRQKALDVQLKLNPESNHSNSESDSIRVYSGQKHPSSNLIKDDEIENDPNNNEDMLWVEKFRPRNFLELLSDDGTNRTLLTWLKLWDKVVYNKEAKKKNVQKDVNDPSKPNDPNAKIPPTEVIVELDPSNRPKQKCALLYGPPGLGKTTLAHIIAATAGYKAVEMNASDDRSLDKFQEKLFAATQMQSVLNKSGNEKPNCLIVDEIDGSLAPVVNFLVDIMTGKASSSKSKRKGKKDIILQRPIICICNDLYVPALRPLRQQALLIPFPPTLSSRLAQRLNDIAIKQKLKTDMTALLALAEKTDNDIRACLSTLQFFKSKSKYMRAVDVHKSNVGQKDARKSLRKLWEELFQIPRSSSKRKFVGTIDISGKNEEFVQEESLSTLPARYTNILKSVQSCGDYEKMMQGAFENYLLVKFKDHMNLLNVRLGNEWMQFYDLMQQQLMHSQNYSTMGYLPYTFVAFHLCFAASGPKPQINWPNIQYEMKTKLQKSKHIVDSMIADMLPGSRIFASPTTLICDILPCLLKIIQTNLRPVNTQLYSAREKQDLRHLVEILVAYNLTYVQEMTPEGQYTYRLEPELEDVVYFPNITHSNLPYSVKQLVAHEVEVEKMRRKEHSNLDTSTKIKISNEDNTKNAKTTENKQKMQASTVPNHLQKLKAKEVQVKERVPVDFFGRKIEKAANLTVDSKGSKKEGLVFGDVWFKFKEGYNNAVRRTIRMKDLL